MTIPTQEPDDMARTPRGIRLADTPRNIPALEAPYPAGAIFRIALEHVRPDPDQPRKEFPEAPLRALGASIKERQEDPIVLRHAPTDTNPLACILVHGERRWRAAQLAGLTELDARIDPHDTAGLDHLIRQAVDNAHRAEHTPWDWVLTFQQLRDRDGLGPTEIAERLTAAGIPWSRSNVSNHLRLLDLPDWAQDAIRAGTLTPSHGKTLLPLKDHPQVLDAVRVRIAPQIAPQAPKRPSAAAGAEAADSSTSIEPLTVERLRTDLDRATHATAACLRYGATVTAPDGERIYYHTYVLSDADRTACRACPRFIDAECGPHCGPGADWECLAGKVTAAREASEAPYQPSDEQKAAWAAQQAEREAANAVLEARRQVRLATLVTCSDQHLLRLHLAGKAVDLQRYPPARTDLLELIQDPVAMAEARDRVLASLIGRAPWTDEGDAQFSRWAQDPAAEASAPSRAPGLGWTHDTPTESGWYWYSDGDYGPAPVYLLRRRSRTPGTIAMRVDQVAVREGMGQDQDLLGVLASDLPGRWRPLAERAPESYHVELHPLHAAPFTQPPLTQDEIDGIGV